MALKNQAAYPTRVVITNKNTVQTKKYKAKTLTGIAKSLTARNKFLRKVNILNVGLHFLECSARVGGSFLVKRSEHLDSLIAKLRRPKKQHITFKAVDRDTATKLSTLPKSKTRVEKQLELVLVGSV